MKIQFIYLYVFRKYSLRFLRSTQFKKKKKQSDMSHKYQSHICQKNEMCVNLSNESLRKLIHKSIIENALHIIWTHKKQYNSYSF